MYGQRRIPPITCDIKDFMKQFKLKNDKICDIMKRLDQDLRKALAGDESASSECYQTYIQDFPTGMESGRYLVLDLGGSHFRIMIVSFQHHKKFDCSECRTYTFPDEKKIGNSDEFFDFIAECVEIFLVDLNLKKENLAMSFCFSFPVKMQGLTKAYLTKWTKTFAVSGVEGKDIVELLGNAFDKRQLNIRPIVVINDTAGCLLSCLWSEHKCRVGVIIGTGTNVCFVEKIENIHNFDGDAAKPEMIINTELGNFGNSGCLDDIRTDFDRKVDASSRNPGVNTFEKMISALYFSELVRLVILKCIELKYLFDGETSELLNRKRCFLPEFIYEIEGDETPELDKTLSILEIMKFQHASLQDCVNVRYICKTICRRSAKLLAAAVATVVNKMAINHVAIAYDGGVYKKHPTYKEILRDKICGYVNEGIAVEHRLSEEGSGRGAALVIAMYMNQQNPPQQGQNVSPMPSPSNSSKSSMD